MTNQRKIDLGKKLLTALIVAGCILAFLTVTSYYLLPKNNQTAYGMHNQEANGILGEPSYSVDAIFLGDSLTSAAISPLQIWEEQGFTSYTCATNGQTLPYSLTMLERILKHQAPKVVVIEANTVFKSFSWDDKFMRALQDAFPVFEFHNSWKSLTLNNFAKRPRTTWTAPQKGFYINKKTLAPKLSASKSYWSYMNPTNAVQTLPDLNREYLEEILRLCEEAGVQPVVAAVPSIVSWSAAKNEAMEQIAEEYQLDFIELNTGQDQVPIDWATETRDGGDHVNYNGAVKVTSAIGKILKSKYALHNRHNDDNYNFWNEALEAYKEVVDKN